MTSILGAVAVPGFFHEKSPMMGVATVATRPRRMMVVKAEGQGINPDIRKTEEKVVDSVVVTELSKNITAYCRCWRSGTFPLCDGSHVKHNKATGDNVGPLLLKKHMDLQELFSVSSIEVKLSLRGILKIVGSHGDYTAKFLSYMESNRF